MSDEIERVETLIGKYKEFAHSKPDTGWDWQSEFGHWLGQASPSPQKDEHEGVVENDTMIGVYLISLYNLIRSRLNKLTNHTPFSNIMDYQFLSLLKSHGRQRKTDLIAMNHMEMSSGIEIVRRLLKRGWIGEEANTDDRRSKWVAVTPAGERVVSDLQAKIDDFYRSFCSGLEDWQKSDILRSLTYLVSRI